MRPTELLHHDIQGYLEDLTSFVNEWELNNDIRSRVAYLITDNERATTSAVSESDYRGLRCYAHTLQLVIKDALDNLKSKSRGQDIINLINKGTVHNNLYS